MSDAPITLAEMVAEAELCVCERRADGTILEAVLQFDRGTPDSARRIRVMEEIARYLRREMEEGRWHENHRPPA